MTRNQTVAISVLTLLLLAALASGVLNPDAHTRQVRESPSASPSRSFPLGTDYLGRDRMTRLLFATRISLVLAPAAALLATLLAAFAGGTAGYFGGWWDKCTVHVIDLMLSLPWLFLLLAARALLPLNAPPIASIGITYGLLAVLGWAGPARVIRAGARKLRESDFALQAAAEGCGDLRMLWRHVLPNLKPVLIAQIWTTIPVFILAEANLGLLGSERQRAGPHLGQPAARTTESVFASAGDVCAPSRGDAIGGVPENWRRHTRS